MRCPDTVHRHSHTLLCRNPACGTNIPPPGTARLRAPATRPQACAIETHRLPLPCLHGSITHRQMVRMALVAHWSSDRVEQQPSWLRDHMLCMDLFVPKASCTLCQGHTDIIGVHVSVGTASHRWWHKCEILSKFAFLLEILCVKCFQTRNTSQNDNTDASVNQLTPVID